ncbi:LysR family transcriptional regulator [Paenalcaligenes niemegkensis]|uniref:LysR family transcriptional regulator n=1 Tax=Paenalcaligenes niemegkensis TaxID=2895469 RepID=UPI0027E25C5F|nr:LysR family transcriptional regulator [Paenalcaligenes niemegkensis]
MEKNLSASLLAWLRSFDAAARNLSFTRAATELSVTQGSVSQQVKKLEEYLGVALFVRGNRNLQLTHEGEQLSVTTQRSFQDLAREIASFRPSRQNETVTAISCSPSFAMIWLTPRMGSLMRAHPETAIRVHGEFHMLDRFRMEEDDIKAAIRFDPGHYNDIRATEFLNEWLIPVASPAFLSAHPDIAHHKSIPAKFMLHDAKPWDAAPENTEWDHWLKKSGHELPVKHTGMHFNLSQLAITAALSGQGIAMGRMALVIEDLKKGHLVAPIPIAVKSQASYHFVSPLLESDEVKVLRRWLEFEGRRFKTSRDSYIEQKLA